MKQQPSRIFVYGTLLGGKKQCKVWPHESDSIQSAYIEASLHDLGPYPAIVHGPGRVLGELHHLSEETWGASIEALDAFEEFDPESPDSSLYTRELVEVHFDSGTVTAWAYFLKRNTIAVGLGTKYKTIGDNATFLGLPCTSWIAHQASKEE